jgi:hypothetical protein
MALAQYTQPIYEAVVANLALENMRREETERQDEAILTKAFECLTATKHVIRLLTENDFSTATHDGIPPVHVAMCILVNVCRNAVNGSRNNLSQVCEKYRDAMASVLDDLDVVVNRLEDIAEGWCMAVDKDLTAEIRHAISASSPREDAEIQDWRVSLASIPD